MHKDEVKRPRATTTRLLPPPLLVLFNILLACTAIEVGAGRDDVYSDLNVTVTTVTGELLAAPPVIGQPWDVRIAGSSLWVLDAAGDPELHEIDLVTGRLVKSVGKRGGGPAELIGAGANIEVDPGRTQGVWAFDGSGQRLLHFAGNEQYASNPTVLDGSDHAFKAVWIAPSLGLAVTGDPARRFIVFDSTGRTMRALPGDMLGADSIPMPARIRATVSRFSVCVRPGGSHVALGYANAGKITIHDREFLSTVQADTPIPLMPEFRRDERTGQLRFTRTFVAYLNCVATDQHIYALFGGTKWVSGQNVSNNSATDVHVFDWHGVLVQVIKLSTPVAAIAVDATELFIIGVSLEDAGVYRFGVGPDPR